MLRIGMLTSGGDCQALNAAMRGVVKGVCTKRDDGGVSDEFNSYLKQYGLSRILRGDIDDFKRDLSTMDLTIKDLSQINDADLAKYMKEK